MSELSVIGKSIPKIDAVELVTGRGKFCFDFKMPGMLYAKVLRSPYPHANITRMDTSKAERLPGVGAVVTGKDAPPRRFGLILRDQYVLARDNRVRAVGEAVAAVAADTIEIAEEALKLIEVDYEELPGIFDPEVSLEMEPPTVIHPDYSEYFAPEGVMALSREVKRAPNVSYHFYIYDGDVEKGFKEADFIVENRFSTPRIHHCQLETHNAVAWVDPDGTLVVKSSTQGPWMAHDVLAGLFNLPPTKVRVMSSYIGGGYGGKQGVIIEPIPMLLAIKSGRPVNLVLTREEQFVDSHQRTAIITYIKDGVKRDGTIIARQMKIIVDFGRHAAALAVVGYSGYSALSTYRIPNFKLDNYGVYTNNPITSPFRGIGVPEIIWGLEQQMDIIAEKVGIDPVELRKKHILKEGELNASGEATHSNYVRECLDKACEWIKLDEKPKQDKGPWRKGKGVAIGNKFTCSIMESVVAVKVHCDGTIEVRHGTAEMGQGINTVLTQIAAEEFGTSPDHVKVVFGDTAFTPFDHSAVSSRATFYTGHAAQRACWDAKRQVFDIASGILGLPPGDLKVKDSVIYAPAILGGGSIKISDLFHFTGVSRKGGEIIGMGHYIFPVTHRDAVTGKSLKPVTYYSYAAHAVEMAVNVETGQVKVLKIIGVFDIGTPIHPKMVEGQIHGGLAMGIGTSLYEEVVLEKGTMLNPSFADYKLASFMDMPSNENSEALTLGIPYEEGPFGAKGVGESTLVTVAPAIGNAIYNAVGVRMDSLPITQEKLWRKLKEQNNASR